MANSERIKAHYERCWGCESRLSEWKLGPTHELPESFQVLVFPPTGLRKMWTYATCGMSQQGDAVPVELHLLSPIQAAAHAELLTATAHYHLTGEYLDVGHTVNFGRPWLLGSECDHGLVSLPYLDGPQLEWLQEGRRRIRFLWLLPLTAKEVEFKKLHGLDALERRFEERSIDYLDPNRASLA